MGVYTVPGLANKYLQWEVPEQYHCTGDMFKQGLILINKQGVVFEYLAWDCLQVYLFIVLIALYLISVKI